ncbi:MFS transporter [Kribbella sp. NPDC056861]|uniref:MFS transporter n=1 Tax=Kribbella sp. NPDC056861 TaxID=3154857 RepID=UPI00342C72E8
MSTSFLPDAGQPEPVVPPPAGDGAPPGGWPNPGTAFRLLLGLAGIGAAMANLVPAVLTLSIKASAIDEPRATTIVSLVVSISALCSMIAFPAFGRLSDRTTSRWGRRRPFLLLSALLFAIGGVGTAAATGTLALVLAAIATAVGFSAATVALNALVADQFEPLRRGTVSAVLGLSLPVGVVIGLFLAQLVSPHLNAMILLPAGIGVIGCVLFAVLVKDQQVTVVDRTPFGLSQLVSTYWVSPLRSPDFAWAWFSRFLIFFGVAAIQAYQAFYLMRVFHYTPDKIAGVVFLSTLVLTGGALIFAPIAGKLSDRTGRRKPFVIAAALIFGTGLLLAAIADSFSFFLVAVAVVGIGQGVYFAVDIALVTQLLPDPANPAKDLGIMNLANNLPSSVVPALAPAILAIGASAASPQNFPLLFVCGAVAGLLGAALIIPIAKVR